jgi:murein L,D-transpeptidase YafK
MKKSIKVTLFILVIMFLVVGVVAFMTNKDQHPLPSGIIADKVLIEKKERRLTVLKKGKSLKTYSIALGPNPEGKKLEEGDKRTPEGTYTIDRRKERSHYHRALHISYPNPDDIAQAKARGVSPGGDIMIHGLPNGIGLLGKLHVKKDWTLGCVAVTNPEIEEIWRVVPDGTTVVIVR